MEFNMVSELGKFPTAMHLKSGLKKYH